MSARDDIAGFETDIIGWRRHLHSIPELAFQEHETSAFVAAKLEEWGIPYERMAGTGIVASIRRGGSSRSIGIRADMDALPLQENSNFEWRSKTDGRMHACGHDGHTATLLGAARYLATEARFDGTVHLIFQPAEEGLGGARVMVEEGLFERFPCSMVFGAHNDPLLAAGAMSVCEGAVMAASDTFTITIQGKSGHAARPHQTIDPLIAGCNVAMTLQTLISRRMDAHDSVVVSITEFLSGNTTNVIPETARLRGTVRTLDPAVQAKVEVLLGEIVNSTVAAHGATAEVKYVRGYPSLINDRGATAVAAEAAIATVGAENVVRQRKPSMGAEDFAYMAGKVPACFVRIGQNDGHKGNVALHNVSYDYNDDTLLDGAVLWAELVEHMLPSS